MLNRFSSTSEKREATEALFDVFSELLFERVNLINGVSATSLDVTDTVNYGMLLRIPDTSVRNFMRPDRKLRFRCTFYLKAPAKADCYILVPATLNSLTSPTQVTDFNRYVGLRILNGVVSLVSGGAENLTVSTTYDIGAGSPSFSDTYYLEIFFNVNSAQFFLNNVSVGTISCDLASALYTYQTFYPVICPIKSSDGTAVQVVFESYQILQDK
jgi:hypothetical protein